MTTGKPRQSFRGVAGPGERAAALTGGMVVCGLLAALIGCDVPPPPPNTADGRPVKTVLVNPADAAEAAAVRQLRAAEAQYRQALEALRAYYEKTGNYDKQRWVEREQKNLTRSRPWKYTGLEAPAPTGRTPIENVGEPGLVEQVLAARQGWKEALAALEDHYQAEGLNFKLALIRNVQRRFDPVRTYRYFLEAEIPPASLRPTEAIAAADALYQRALKLHREGKPLPAVTDYNKQRKALLLLLELVRKYPTSTKIAKAAFYIGEIYKEYFNENIRAVHWYQRAWQWDPKLMLPARFQAAVVYDYRLAQPGKALPLYQAVLRHEQFNASNVSFAAQRIEELTRPKE